MAFVAELAYRSLKVDEAALRAARHVIHLDASHGPTSLIGQAASACFAELGKVRPDLQVEHVRLWEESTRRKMEYNLEHVRAKMSMLQGDRSETVSKTFSDIEALAARVATAQGLIVSAPVWNFSVPWVLKQYFDCVLHPGLTFVETPSGPRGLLGGGRPLLLLTSSGGSGVSDFVEPWIVQVGAMLGFDRFGVAAARNASKADREALLHSFSKDAEVSVRQLFSGEVRLPAEEKSEEEIQMDCTHEELLRWLQSQGGLSADALESIEAAQVGGELFLTASEADWSEDELGLSKEDIARLQELQAVFAKRVSVEVRRL